jgi:hypothetical protein
VPGRKKPVNAKTNVMRKVDNLGKYKVDLFVKDKHPKVIPKKH